LIRHSSNLRPRPWGANAPQGASSGAALTALIFSCVVLASCSGGIEPGPSAQSSSATSQSGIPVAVDFARFVAANGATYDRASGARPTISEADARRIALDATSGARVLSTETGALTWPQSRLDRRAVWLVYLAPPTISMPTEYVFIDGQSGLVLWKFGSE